MKIWLADSLSPRSPNQTHVRYDFSLVLNFSRASSTYGYVSIAPAVFMRLSYPGGEKSYAQMCLIAALWDILNPPADSHHTTTLHIRESSHQAGWYLATTTFTLLDNGSKGPKSYLDKIPTEGLRLGLIVVKRPICDVVPSSKEARLCSALF